MSEKYFFEPPLWQQSKTVKRQAESSDVVADALLQTEKMFIRPTVKRQTITALFVFIAIVMLGLTIKSMTMQVWGGEKYLLRAEANRIKKIRIPAARGIIFDALGQELAENSPSYTVSIIGADIAKDPAAITSVSSTLQRYGISESEFNTAFEEAKKTPFEQIVVADRLSHEQAIALTVESAELPGVVVDVATRRIYLADSKIKPQSSAHVLGYVNRISRPEYEKLKSQGYGLNDWIGKTGIEASLESVLRGSPGFREIEVDALGRERRIVSVKPPQNGKSLRLSIDLLVQNALESALRAELGALRLRRASAVAIDPENGMVLAMVSLPAHDPNAFSGGIKSEEYEALIKDPDEPLFSRAVAGSYPSGSTIKPIIAIAALAEKIISPNTTIFSTGGIWYGRRWFFPDWKIGGHGPTNVYKAIAESVNTFFYTIGGGTENFSGLGPEKIKDYANRFGLGAKTGIELPSEAAGLIPSPDWKVKTKGEEWYIGDSYHLAIGQGDVLVTPLQMAAATGAIANGGTLWRPSLISSIYDPTSEKWVENTPQKISDLSDLKSEISVVRDAMRRTVTLGSAKALQSAIVPVAGKTGTAEWSSVKKPQAWFVGFAPFEKPKIAIAILIEEGGEGSSAAVPVARQFINWYFSQPLLN